MKNCLAYFASASVSRFLPQLQNHYSSQLPTNTNPRNTAGCKQSPDAAFYRLSEELLTLIADYVAGPIDSRASRSLLKPLRLAHPQFAYLTRLQAKFFRKLTFVSSREGIALLQDTAALARLRRFVQKIKFRPSAYSILLGPKLFKEITVAQAIRQYSQDQEICVLWYSTGPPQPVQKRWSINDDPPFTQAELDEGFERCRKLAREAENLRLSGRVAET